MRAVVQRVSDASVTVDDQVTGSIERGILVYLGVYREDNGSDLSYIVRKVANLRIFTDQEGKMNRCILQESGKILLVSQFTLCAITTKGNRPSFNPAAPPEMAQDLYEQAADQLRDLGLEVQTGIFGAHMKVGYINDGPVTIILDSHDIQK
ncbi:MAG: D-tyrosyl-tRNA(Tyr) deacylase [Sphaerochaetaceae bacterium]|nr:D-tyrosyl-tRNA(Tyr) deacylase [Sphaerochaetaceae bacterium]